MRELLNFDHFNYHSGEA